MLPPGAWGQTVCLSVLLALLPFEPRRPVLAFGVSTTLLEAAAAACCLGLLALSWRELGRRLRRPPLPLALLGAYAAAHLAAAATAPVDRGLGFKFALRMVAMAGFAALAAAASAAARRRALFALAASATLVAVLAVLEASGLRSLDALLELFRETPFNVGGWRRATAGSEYPNLAAAILMYGLLAGTALATVAGPARLLVLAWAALLAWGLVCTYSRGAMAATLCGLLAAPLARAPEARSRWLPLAAAGMLLAAAAAAAMGGEAFRLRLAGEGTARWYAAVYAPRETRLRLAPGEQRRTTVRVTNMGLRTWRPADAISLAYHWYDRDRRWLGDGDRVVLPHDVATGDSIDLEAEVRSLGSEGDYVLAWDMVHEHTTWFSDQGVRPAEVPVVVAGRDRPAARPPAVAPAAAGPVAWVPGRAELWRIAFAMWRARPWLGYGPDSFRRLYGPLSGRSFWDARVFANNTLLEAAATTGAAGAFSLAGALAAGLWWARRGAAGGRPDALAAFALLAGIAAHGLVDYVLASTGHYLLLGFAVGAASAEGGA